MILSSRVAGRLLVLGRYSPAALLLGEDAVPGEPAHESCARRLFRLRGWLCSRLDLL